MTATPLITALLLEMQVRRADYVAFLKAWILKRDEGYVRREHLTKPVKPIRHPQGVDNSQGTREHLWGDAIWCQDVTVSTCPEEFFGEVYERYYEACEGDDPEVADFVNECFDEAFRAVMPPEFHHLLEG